ncbi:pantoate--beta-alanine ligase [Deinococcus sonorensis]|uniref:Pantothenate synthetase n=2 Tax=Deinococcus sonorensis TaxID=309891 RepID=A0AAU7U7B9_9DEIO
MTEPTPGLPQAEPQLIRTVADLRSALHGHASVGLVPTMGYLHQGHAQLIRQARAENRLVVVSVFVNPLQFGAGEDLSRYPRDLDHDLRLAGAAGAQLLFAPTPEQMYPDGFVTQVQVGGLAGRLEGASRPGHFDGVATVVLKLLNLVQPQRAYFGEKDWQQLAVVRRMVQDLNHPAQIVGVPTVREPTGLALSSRNSYLSPEQRARAAVLSAGLRAVQAAWAAGERQPEALLQAGLWALQQEPELQLDYLSVVDAELNVLAQLGSSVPSSEQTAATSVLHNTDMTTATAAAARLLIAARMFGVRLIDNMPLIPVQP